jgi:methyl-accepting chemotaxis protein
MQLDELTQQNAALVEEASAASQAMAEQARGLNSSMERYRVNEDAEQASAPANNVAAATTERRKASRPWSGKPAPAAAPAAVGKTRAASGTDDAVWKDF